MSLQCPLLRVSKVYLVLAIISCVCECLVACGPGRVASSTRRGTPMKYRQRIPDVDEVSLQASGEYVGPVERGSEAYEDLEKNYNPNIDFKKLDNNEDNRRMTKVASDTHSKSIFFLEYLCVDRQAGYENNGLHQLRKTWFP